MRIGKFTHNLQVLNQNGITVEKSVLFIFESGVIFSSYLLY